MWVCSCQKKEEKIDQNFYTCTVGTSANFNFEQIVIYILIKVPVVIHVFHRLPWSEFTSVQSLMVMCQIESVVGNFLTLKFYLIFTPQCIGIVITDKQVVIFKTSFSKFEKKDKIG